jgi:hypothetical protein
MIQFYFQFKTVFLNLFVVSNLHFKVELLRRHVVVQRFNKTTAFLARQIMQKTLLLLVFERIYKTKFKAFKKECTKTMI